MTDSVDFHGHNDSQHICFYIFIADFNQRPILRLVIINYNNTPFYKAPKALAGGRSAVALNQKRHRRSTS